jgi:3-oxoacid CoA-transferase A subunit
MSNPTIKCPKLKSIGEAMQMIKSGSRIMISGFGNSGDPKMLTDALCDLDIEDLTIISNDLGSPKQGLGRLLSEGKIKGLVGTYYNWNPEVAESYNEGKINVDLVPQGTLAEAIRAAGVGVAGFYTPTAVGTELGKKKETKSFNGRSYVLQEAVHADVALLSALKADRLGNLVYYKTARNFNPVMAMAADLVIAEVENIVPEGELDPECIVTPHIFVDVLVLKG